MSDWTVQHAVDHYGIDSWGRPFFTVNERGHMVVHPTGRSEVGIDLKDLVDEIEARGIDAPMLIRFPDILKRRMEELNGCFARAIREQNFKGQYRGVYPIKVNQERLVVEALMRAGKEFSFGLEAGSKPELMAILAMGESNGNLFICNGYKDEEYIEMALLATKLGRKVIIVLEKLTELESVLKISEKNSVKPLLGIRAKLRARGTGRWEYTSGDQSKFGLTPAEMIRVTDELRSRDLLDSLQLLHFHIGSQISHIGNMKNAIKEAARFYVELKKLGTGMRYLDVGGGLAVDYDGSNANTDGSMNYTIQEYANDVVFHVLDTCDQAGVEHPDLVSESGRALTAHHSLLVCNIVGASEIDEGLGDEDAPDTIDADDPHILKNLRDTWEAISTKNVREFFHDAVQMRDEAVTAFNLGYLSLAQRAKAERTFWAICRKVRSIIRKRSRVPKDLARLERDMASIYFCNFSVFQSLPDYWAINHLFPILPIHRLNERPTKRAVLADITCDSDGKIDTFIDSKSPRRLLDLHALDDNPYFLGIFMVGAYQEILGDMHNLFGDTNAVMVTVDAQGAYKIDQVAEGDSVEEVLNYVHYDRTELMHRLRIATEEAVRNNRMTLEETRRMVDMFRKGLDSYTYLVK